MSQVLELLPERVGDTLVLRSPEVGFFTCALPAGALLAPGAPAGVLHSLGRRFDLVAPAGALGRVVNARPERVLAPVGYGTVLYELAAIAAGLESAAEGTSTAAGAAGLVLRAPYSGRFWQRPSPNDPTFVREGDTVAEGQTLGLLEVMKTFTHLVYHPGRHPGGHPGGELPARARVVRFLVADGGEVKDGGALLALEPV